MVFVVAAAISGSSCHRSAPGTAKRYPFTGRIVSLDGGAQTAIIDGDAIPGFMEAMAMPYKIKPAAAMSHLLPGDTISAEVVVVQPSNSDAPPDYWLENIKVTSHKKDGSPAAANSLHMPEPGEPVPDFSFTNQSGRRISLSQYRGKILFVTFIYTRCPFPDFCPRVSSNFAEIYKQIGSSTPLADAHLLSISFDPQRDTPQVLRDYGYSVAHTHDSALFRRWEFAAPKASDLPKLEDFFALTVQPDGGMITHNLSTALIGRDGKIVQWYHGSDWQPSDLLNVAANLPKS